MQLYWPFSFSSDDLKKFSELSGDFNPIHSNVNFARKKGFTSPIIYGLLLASQASRLIGQELPDSHAILTGVQMDFTAPAFAGDDLKFFAQLIRKSDSTHALEFKCHISRVGTILARGRVGAIWKP